MSRTSQATGKRRAGERERPATALLSGRTDITAVFAANDSMALGALTPAKELGRAVPGNLSIVGFDDLPESAFYMPPLTTVVQDYGAFTPALKAPSALAALSASPGPVPHRRCRRR